jgi:hypothetical protein
MAISAKTILRLISDQESLAKTLQLLGFLTITHQVFRIVIHSDSKNERLFQVIHLFIKGTISFYTVNIKSKNNVKARSI